MQSSRTTTTHGARVTSQRGHVLVRRSVHAPIREVMPGRRQFGKAGRRLRTADLRSRRRYMSCACASARNLRKQRKTLRRLSNPLTKKFVCRNFEPFFCGCVAPADADDGLKPVAAIWCHARSAGHHSCSVLGLEQTGTAGKEVERHAYSDGLRGQQRPEEHTVRLATSSLLKTAGRPGCQRRPTCFT